MYTFYNDLAYLNNETHLRPTDRDVCMKYMDMPIHIEEFPPIRFINIEDANLDIDSPLYLLENPELLERFYSPHIQYLKRELKSLFSSTVVYREYFTSDKLQARYDQFKRLDLG